MEVILKILFILGMIVFAVIMFILNMNKDEIWGSIKFEEDEDDNVEKVGA